MQNYATKYIGAEVGVKIDRPLGSRHPKHHFVYEVNYGYVPDTVAPDGEEVDAYVLGVSEVVTEYTGVCIAVIHRTNDDDDKLVVMPKEHEWWDDERIRAATHFQEQWFESIIIRNL